MKGNPVRNNSKPTSSRSKTNNGKPKEKIASSNSASTNNNNPKRSGNKVSTTVTLPTGRQIELAVCTLPPHAKTRKPNRPIKYITIHYTGYGYHTTSKGAAKDIMRDHSKQSAKAFADFAVDDDTIIMINSDIKNYYNQAIGFDTRKGRTPMRFGKHVTDANNTNSISVEMCSSHKKGTNDSEPNHSGWTLSNKVIENALYLTGVLMYNFNIPKSRVIRHYDAVGKRCPGVFGWNDEAINDEITGKPKVPVQYNNSNKWKQFWNSLQPVKISLSNLVNYINKANNK